jgi:hypothetical protein
MEKKSRGKEYVSCVQNMKSEGHYVTLLKVCFDDKDMKLNC